MGCSGRRRGVEVLMGSAPPTPLCFCPARVSGLAHPTAPLHQPPEAADNLRVFFFFFLHFSFIRLYKDFFLSFCQDEICE